MESDASISVYLKKINLLEELMKLPKGSTIDLRCIKTDYEKGDLGYTEVSVPRDSRLRGKLSFCHGSPKPKKTAYIEGKIYSGAEVMENPQPSDKPACAFVFPRTFDMNDVYVVKSK